MKAGSTRIAHVLAGIVIGLSSSSASLADDTELFIANADPLVTGAQPNILFIIDTSGSMKDPVLTQVAWDPNLDFTGCYNKDAIYFTTTGTMPGCSTDNYFWASQFYCEAAAGSLDGLGQYQDEFQAWRNRSGTANDRWVDLNGNRKNRKAECKNDGGNHGDGGAGTWAADGANGPWSNDSNDQITWNQDYTVYTGNWLNWNSTGGTISTAKIDVVKNVSEQLLNNVSGVNIGLMRFNRNEYANQSGGPVIFAMENVDAARANMISTIKALPTSGWTPLSETLYEAQQYFAGRAVDMGNLDPPVISVGASRTGGSTASNTYAAPVNFACQKNYVVLLTDGLPTRDTDAENKIEALPQFSTLIGNDCTGSGHGSCLDDLAGYMHDYDFDSNLPGVQNVTTYTVGFDADFPLLLDTATKGGGEYRIADDAASLATQLTEIVLSILDDATTFTAPAVPVNAFNRIRNLDDVFVSLFEPSGHAHWPGNLKKYKLQGGKLVGQDGVPAVDASTGFFTSTAHSYWSGAVDGDRVRAGGAANEQPAYVSRNLYTNIAGSNLSSAGNSIEVGNAAITDVLLGSLPLERDTVINWARGLDVNDEDDDGLTNDVRNVMGDPLHVRPVTIIYGGTEAAPDSVVYLSTNDGYLHAIDADDGSELWAFVPTRLLPRLYENYLDPLTPNKRYGLDGDIRAYVANDDFIPGITGTEKVYLVFGMRRGGDAMFALDVTDRNNPKLVWEIDSNDTAFDDLGQTWSTPAIVRIAVGGSIKHVAVFGGGYDAGQDNPGYRTDSAGNAIYMVDLETGTKLWSAGKDNSGSGTHELLLPDMEHSFPSAVNVFDITGNGLADRMYVGDMGGRIWRFDIVNGEPAIDLVEGGVLAELGGGGQATAPPAADVRRFYAKTDVVANFPEEAPPYLSINVGSGHRAHPLDGVTDDEFYSVRDFAVFDVIESDSYPTPVQRADLIDITNDTSPTMLPYDAGWRLSLNAAGGEKVLTSSTTLRGTTFFTSFAPGGAANSCTAALGSNRLYRVDVTDGRPDPHPDEADPGGNYTPEDRYTVTNQGGIAPEPTFFIVDNPDDPNDADGDGESCVGTECDDPTICIGPWCFDSGISNPYERTFWFQDETQ